METERAPVAPLELAWRLLWICVRVMFVTWLATPGAYFVYQGF